MRAHRAYTKSTRGNAVWYAGAAQRACRWRPAMAPLALPALDGLNWSKIRALAKERAAAAPADEVVAAALPLLDAPDAPHRMLAGCLPGYTALAQPEQLAGPLARRAGGCRNGDLGSGRPTRGVHLCPRAEGALRRRSLLRQVPTPAQALDQALRIGRAANFEQYIVHAWERLLPEPRHTRPETRQRARVIGARGVRRHELVLSLRIELPELRALGLM